MFDLSYVQCPSCEEEVQQVELDNNDIKYSEKVCDWCMERASQD